MDRECGDYGVLDASALLNFQRARYAALCPVCADNGTNTRVLDDVVGEFAGSHEEIVEIGYITIHYIESFRKAKIKQILT